MRSIPIRKRRVLHLIHSMAHGGIETAVLNWARYFDRDRFQVEVCCFAGDRGREQAFLRAAASAGIPAVHTIPWRRSKPLVQAARQLALHVKELDIDIVHTHSYYANLVGAALKFFTHRAATVTTAYVWGRYDPLRMFLQT